MNTKFRTKYQPIRCFTPAGSPEVIQYVGKYDSDGVLVLEESGITNIYNEIQSHADSVDLNTIIRRYESGEVDVLSRVQGVYEDITGCPTTYAEMLNMIRLAEEVFDQLPAEVRSAYGNSFEQFFAQDGMSRLKPESEKGLADIEIEEGVTVES